MCRVGRDAAVMAPGGIAKPKTRLLAFLTSCGGVSAAAGRGDGRGASGKRVSEHPARGAREKRRGGCGRECDESETSRQASDKHRRLRHAHTGRGEEGEVATLLGSCLIKATADRLDRHTHACNTRAQDGRCVSRSSQEWRPEDLFLGGGWFDGKSGWREKERFARLLLQGHARFYSSDAWESAEASQSSSPAALGSLSPSLALHYKLHAYQRANSVYRGDHGTGRRGDGPGAKLAMTSHSKPSERVASTRHHAVYPSILQLQARVASSQGWFMGRGRPFHATLRPFFFLLALSFQALPSEISV